MKLGIYGGTFSPPHMGHIAAAKAFVKEMSLDRLMIIPTFIPPHKAFAEEATPEERLDMCRLAFADIECAEISDIEIRRGGKSFTYLTLEELASDGAELFLLCGTDMILTMDEWKNFERIFELSTVCYARRESDPETDERIMSKVAEYRAKYGADIRKIDHSVIEVSSTELRRAIAEHFDGTGGLDKKTLAYILERGLYK